MAFVARAERKFDQPSSNELGPGAYLGPNEYKKPPGYAPFNSLAERANVSTRAETTPGPGAYQVSGFGAPDVNQEFFGVKQTSVFASKQTRFNEKANAMAPGPGQYEIKQKWPSKKQVQQKTEWHTVNWLRLPSAPSIPSHDQVYGYDETVTGDLIMKKNPKKVFTGKSGDQIGPGQYEIRKNLINPQSGTNWSKFTSKRMKSAPQGTNEMLGPGCYSNQKFEIAPLYKFRPNANFVSRTKRSCYIPNSKANTKASSQQVSNDIDEAEDESGDEEVPGPGTYFDPNKHSSFQTKPVPERIQFFGSTQERFKQDRKLKQQELLGPGIYGDLRKPIYQKKPGDSKAPFTTTKARFEVQEDSKPGPGAYQQASLVENLNKKVVGKHGVFGSTEKRFVYKQVENAPGPGYYPPDAHKRVGLYNSANRKAHSMFLSKTNRNPATNQGVVENPGPGSYDVNGRLISTKEKYSGASGHPLLSNVKVKQVHFNSQSPRFTENKQANIGPGAYEPKEVGKTRSHVSTTNAFINKAQRLEGKAEKVPVPGPGAYGEDELERGWNKRSFNILFSDYT